MRRILALWVLVCASVSAQQISIPTEVSGRPFSIVKTWIIGGEGDWDHLTADPKAGQLFIAHGPVVQVVDMETGTLEGQVSGLREARSIAVDETGQFGYISDAKADEVVVFDRRSLQVTARIPVSASPQMLVYDMLDKLLFAIAYTPPERATRRVASRDANGHLQVTYVSDPTPDRSAAQSVASSIEVIDTETGTKVGRLLFSGHLDSAQFDGQGGLFISVVDRTYVLRIDTHTTASQLRSQGGGDTATLDWRDSKLSDKARLAWTAPNHPDIYRFGSSCAEPKALAVDGHLGRLFVACTSMKLTVWNIRHGELVASLPLNATPDSLAYDADRDLLFVASASGSLTVIDRHVTDSYAVIQELPTRQRARTLAVNQATGEIFLVCNLLGVDLSKSGGIGNLKVVPVPGSFQVLVVKD